MFALPSGRQAVTASLAGVAHSVKCGRTSKKEAMVNRLFSGKGAVAAITVTVFLWAGMPAMAGDDVEDEATERTALIIGGGLVLGFLLTVFAGSFKSQSADSDIAVPDPLIQYAMSDTGSLSLGLSNTAIDRLLPLPAPVGKHGVMTDSEQLQSAIRPTLTVSYAW